MASFIYSQDTGAIFDSVSPVMAPIATGYSGAGGNKNKPDAQCVADLGPIPRGLYTISPMRDVTTAAGHILLKALLLTPDPGNNMCGRAGFYIHGESEAHKGWASEGCIILDRSERERISAAVEGGMIHLDVRAHYGT